MKRLILLFAFISFLETKAQTNATNFTCADCAGNTHDLFTELDSGQVVVIAWVMPCGSCIAPALSAYNECQNYQSSNPGRVVFYIADDYANTSCSTLSNWANTNGMSNAKVFSNSAISMSNYGSAGMPKIVVLGGTSHTVYYNQNNSINVSNFNAAINSALAAVGINEVNNSTFQMQIFPNPSKGKNSLLSYSLSETAKVKIELYNSIGERVQSIDHGQQMAGKQNVQIDFSTMPAGVYFVKLIVGTKEEGIRYILAE